MRSTVTTRLFCLLVSVIITFTLFNGVVLLADGPVGAAGTQMAGAPANSH